MLSTQDLYYRPQRSCGKVIFSQACVVLFTGGVCLSACWFTTPRPGHLPEQAPPLPQEQAHKPQSRTPPPHRAGTTPLGAGTPLAQSMLGDTVNARAVRILLECNLVPPCTCPPIKLQKSQLKCENNMCFNVHETMIISYCKQNWKLHHNVAIFMFLNIWLAHPDLFGTFLTCNRPSTK